MIVAKCKRGHFFDSELYKVCPHCGAPAVTPTAPLTRDTNTGNTTQTSTDSIHTGQIHTSQTDVITERRPIVKYCRRCGERLPADSIFCQYCGTRIVTAPPVDSQFTPPGKGGTKSIYDMPWLGSLPADERDYSVPSPEDDLWRPWPMKSERTTSLGSFAAPRPSFSECPAPAEEDEVIPAEKASEANDDQPVPEEK